MLTIVTSPGRAQEQQEVDWQFSAVDYRGLGKTLNVYCVPSTLRGGTVWGTTVYTDDSSICMAAVHSLATFDMARGGTVYFAMEPGQEGYAADRRRGVQTQTWGVWTGGFRILAGVPGKRLREITDGTPIEITWSTSAKYLRGSVGTDHVMLCPRGGALRPVWGNEVYSDESSICAAAVHAGLIELASGGAVTLRVDGAREDFRAKAKNGIASLAWEKSEGSFTFPKKQVDVALPAPVADMPEPPADVASRFVAATPVPPLLPQPTGEFLIDWSRSAGVWRGSQTGRVITAVCPGGGTTRTVWGSAEYTDDSSVCTAAVHALSTFNAMRGGTVFITMTPGQNGYASETRHGIESDEWGEWESSFRVIGGTPGMTPAMITDTTVVEISWSTTAQHLRRVTGVRRFICPGQARLFPVWGSDVYADHSSICAAAAHAGIITRDAGGPVTVRIEAGRENYASTLRNDVNAQSLGAWPGSFSFRR
jgi:hypothetical protein